MKIAKKNKTRINPVAYIKGRLLSDQLPLDYRLQNAIFTLIAIFAIGAAAFRLLIGEKAAMPLIFISISALLCLLTYISNKFKIKMLCILLSFIIITDILCPMMFYTLGGIRSSMSAYFVLCVFTHFILLSGKLRVILLSIHISIIIFCYMTASSPFFSALFMRETFGESVFDYLQSILMVGCCIGLLGVVHISFFNDETQKSEHAINELVIHDNLLKTLNKVAKFLVGSDPDQLSDTLRKSFAMMGDCIDVDRMSIWRKRPSTDKGSCSYVRAYCWDRDVAHSGTVSETNEDPPEIFLSRAMDEAFISDIIAMDRAKPLAPQHQKYLLPLELKSSVCIPIFFYKDFWGFLSWEDSCLSTEYTEAESDILRSGGLIIANAIVRSEKTRELVKTREEALLNAKAKGDFLSNMSHEMITPMNAIIGMTAIGKSAGTAGKKDYALNKIEEASTHLMDMIQDILDMSNIESKDFDLCVDEFAFENMLIRLVKSTNFRLDEKKLNLSVSYDDRIPCKLLGDERRISKAIAHLLSNAIKFTPEGQYIYLNAELADDGEDECLVKVTVKDEGIGITDEMKEKLFYTFEQAEEGASRKSGGIGLGLPLSKKIIEMMGGTIGFDTQLGNGSSFFITVPLKKCALSDADIMNPDINWKKTRILAIDDDTSALKCIEMFAARHGIPYDLANTTSAAQKFIKSKQTYDLCLIKHEMFKSAEDRFLRWIKNSEFSARLAFLVAPSPDGLSEKHLSAGQGPEPDGYFIEKPLFPSVLARQINSIISKPADKAKAEGEPLYSGRCALLVDDLDFNREIEKSALEKFGISVQTANGGPEAIELFETSSTAFDLIFMDINMPHLDGIETTKRIRSMEDIPNARQIPVIAMSSEVSPETGDEFRASGINAHIEKPIDFSELKDILRQYLPKFIDEPA